MSLYTFTRNRPVAEQRLIDRLTAVGATLVHLTWLEAEGGVLLAVKAAGPTLSYEPYITWNFSMQEDDPARWRADVFAGHYHQRLGKAIADYQERGGDLNVEQY